MALRITDACINCGACEPECPNTAIYEGGVMWRWADGTQLKESKIGDVIMDAALPQKPYSEELYYIVAEKCTECVGFSKVPQCAAVCPVDCCVVDLNYEETEEALLQKKRLLHQE